MGMVRPPEAASSLKSWFFKVSAFSLKAGTLMRVCRADDGHR